MESIMQTPRSNKYLREILLVVVPALVIAGIFIFISHIWDENKALRLALADEMRKSSQEGESANNYLYLLDRYPRVTRSDAYVAEAIDVPTRPGQFIAITLAVSWKQGLKCQLSADAFGWLGSESVFIKPRQVSCNGKTFKVDGMLLRSQAKVVRGSILIVPDAKGQMIPVIRLPKNLPLDAWLQE